MSWILGIIQANLVASIGAAVATPLLLLALKRIPNAWIQGKVGALAYSLGVLCTGGMSKWKWSAKVWNSVVEAYFIDLIDNTLVCFVDNFVKGLKSD